MVWTILGAQALLLLGGVLGGLVLVAHGRWPGPGRALVRGVDRLLVGWEARHVFGTVVVGVVVFVVTAFCVSPR